MKLYITCENKDILRKNYGKIIDRDFVIINTVEMKTLINLSEDDKSNFIYKEYLLFQEIGRLFKNYYQGKRYRSLVYITETIEDELLNNLFGYLRDEKIFFTEINLLDYSNKINSELYSTFSNVY